VGWGGEGRRGNLKIDEAGSNTTIF